MPNDEQQIRDLITEWHRATAVGDLPKVLTLMAEDVVFLVAGHPPMRSRDTFAASFQGALKHFRIESSSEVQEISIAGDMAYCWSHLSVVMKPLNAGLPKHRAGYVLTVLRKTPDGNWVVARDANMLSEVPL
ncbi:MAG: SgcJ/EcaC family oxidoreductase [Pedosphaera sp.]|nr:SgcJ/EcaC family oxidoreductase [Pedosphaera sp.]